MSCCCYCEFVRHALEAPLDGFDVPRDFHLHLTGGGVKRQPLHVLG